VEQFNGADWYACHDGFEELWHETQGPTRPVLQGLLQIAVAELHLERGNRKGATVLMGEGLGRLRRCGDVALGLRLTALKGTAGERLHALQTGSDPCNLPLPHLELARDPDGAPVH
jgi:predicted metal-dependent hydrolase